jgi:hypothetical protein
MAPFGTPGFLWANNNNRDPEVRKEYLAQPDDRPYDLVFSPWNRDLAFNEFYRQHAGEIDAIAGVELWASSPINRAHACDGKITDTEMAEELVFLAHFGKVTLREKFPQKGYRIMPDLPDAVPHLSLGYSVPSPVFVTEKLEEARAAGRFEGLGEALEEPELVLGELASRFELDSRQLWRQTVFPASEADGWFVSASAAYWRMLQDLDGLEPTEAADELAAALAELNARYLYTVSREEDLRAVDATRAYDRYGPYQIPRIKGTFALHQLRLKLGNDEFLEAMRTVHDRYARQSLSTADLIGLISETGGRDVSAEVLQWIERTGLPQLRPRAEVKRRRGGWEVAVEVTQAGEPYRLVTHLAITTSAGRQLREMVIDGASTNATFRFEDEPLMVEFNALRDVPVPNPDFYIWRNFFDDFHQTLIVYGTARQDEANHTLARRWQETLANAYVEILPPLVKDSELTPERAAAHDLIVIGTLADNRLFAELGKGLGLELERNHFRWRDRLYSEPHQGILLVQPNPWNPDRVVYLVAANSALQLHQMTRRYTRGIPSWAIFEHDEVVAQGYHGPAEFRIELRSDE